MPTGIPNKKPEELITKTPMPEEVEVKTAKTVLKADEDGMVKISKEKLDNLLDRLERVEYAASKAGLAKYDDRHKGKMTKQVYLRSFEGKVITSWSDLVVNNVEKDGNGRWSEDQQIKITTEDGKESQMPLFLFTRRYAYIQGEIVSETKNLGEEDFKTFGDYTFKVKVMDKDKVREYTIGSKFVN